MHIQLLPSAERHDLGAVRANQIANTLRLCEDDFDARDMLKVLLELDGHEVVAAKNGEVGTSFRAAIPWFDVALFRSATEERRHCVKRATPLHLSAADL